MKKEAEELDRLEEKRKTYGPLSKSEEDRRVQLTEKLEKFKEISTAYKVLSNPDARRSYDNGERIHTQQTCERESSWEKVVREYRETIDKFYEVFYEIKKSQRESSEELERFKIYQEVNQRFMNSYLNSTIEISEKLSEESEKFGQHKICQEMREISKRLKQKRNGIDKTEEESKTFQDLCEKIMSGNLEGCRSIIGKVTIATDDIALPVRVAIAYDHVEIFNLLSEKRTKVSLNDDLSNATKCGSERISHFLLDKYVDTMDVEYKDEEGNTALHRVLEWFDKNEFKYQNFAKSLLSKGARLDVENKKGETPFDLLLDCTRKFSCAKGEKVESLNNVSALLSDCKIDELKELKCKNGTLALSELVKLAVKCRHEGIFNLLVKNNIQISSLRDEEGNTALHFALNELTYNKGAYEYESFTRFLLSKGARLDVENNEGRTPFYLLVDYVKSFFEWEDAWIKVEEDLIGTSNHKTMQKTMQSLDLVVRLLSNCTDKGILKGLNGTPALNALVRIVVGCNHKEALDLLVENNMQISSTTLNNIVTRDFNEKIFDCFLHKNTVNYQDKSGDTALHHALRHLHCYDSRLCKVVESLASKGARFDVKNDKGETPFDLLIEYVEEGFYGQASRLSYAWKLLNECENKDVLRELKYKDGTPALNKLKELHTKCRNTSIIVAFTLAVAVVALGVAIAVYLEMPMVGIAVGACCLAAAVIYCCSKPSKSLENSNVQGFSEGLLQLTL